jgi:hypothetical protein
MTGEQRDSSRPVLVVVLLLGLCSCGGPQRGGDGGDAWHEVRFKAAALPARRASGAPWHMSAGDRSAGLLGGLIGLAVGYPEIGFALGSSLVQEPEPEAPAPYIAVKIRGDTFQISPVGQTLSPRWSQPIAIEVGRYRAGEKAIVQVLDAVDEGAVLGQREFTVGELLASGSRTLTEIGEVASLDVEVAVHKARPAQTVDTYVDASRSLDDLTAGKDERWTAIPVWNGDRVTIEAGGSICPSRPTPCFGPDGADPGRWTSYNYDEFKEARHAALVAVLPGEGFVVGERVSLIAEQSGFLLLFVNDTDEGNNEGGFDVRVTVTPGRQR